MSVPHFHLLHIARVTPQAAGAVAITFAIASELRDTFRFQPGQFLTLRANINGNLERRNYSICSSTQQLASAGEIEIGIKPVTGGVFSNWAVTQLKSGDTVEVMPPDGRFTSRLHDAQTVQRHQAAGAAHRVGFAAGSGITPLLSIISSTLQDEPQSRFTLVYGNQRVDSILFNERLQDLKDRYPARLSLIHILSRQAQEVALMNGHIDSTKVEQLLSTLIPVSSIDEAFVCGPEGMMTAAERALRTAGLSPQRLHVERFFSAGAPAPRAISASAASVKIANDVRGDKSAFELDVIIDGKTHHLGMNAQDKVLDVALAAGLDLPFACRGGVCCTCRARVLEGEVAMEKNYTLEKWEMDKGFVLTCQARALTSRVVVSYDER